MKTLLKAIRQAPLFWQKEIIALKAGSWLGACIWGTCLVGVCGAAPAAEGVADPPKPHWSHLPVWGVEAEARGYQLPLPFGVGFNYYHEQQPFNIKDLQVSRGGDPVSVNEFLQLDQVDTTQHNGILRLDAWLFPFLNIYGLAGFTSGEMQGLIVLPEIPILGIPAQDLPLNIATKDRLSAAVSLWPAASKSVTGAC